MLVEYRIPMPLTLEEYRIGQLYTTNQQSRESTDGNSAVQILDNRPFSDENGTGQRTHKRLHMGDKLPRWLDACLPAAYKVADEISLNMYPLCQTEYKHNKFPTCKMMVRTLHVADDCGRQHNVFGLSEQRLKERQVITLDLGKDGLQGKPADRNPALCRSEVTGRGPLTEGWMDKGYPMMCAYKLVDFTIDSYLLWAVSGKFTNYIRDLMLSFNQYVFCLLDKWHGLSIEDIRKIEQDFKDEADRIVNIAHLEERERTPDSVRTD